MVESVGSDVVGDGFLVSVWETIVCIWGVFVFSGIVLSKPGWNNSGALERYWEA